MPEPIPKLKVVEKTTWANPEEVAKTVQRFKEYTESHRVNAVVIVAEQSGGGLYTLSSRHEDKFKLAAGLMLMAMEMLGFASKDRDE